ncbi:hypothetical protein [Ruminococcus albus]|uniref:DUF4367 domain-containing protein n=1 Tax=Ruminococcus albus TaxID=1264 RepID=A0A1I1KNQ3_RUMAL|nr:hypothetical protein [Ruminococcus albus]SFC59763.1 hypothetical protein SAMN02910406_02001 [Ruminococcus albus]
MSKYNEIMEHIELNDKMRERIIGNIGARQKRKRISTAVKMISAAAACLVIAVGAAALLNRDKIPQTPDESSPNVAKNDEGQVIAGSADSEDGQTEYGFDVQEYGGAQELSDAFGVKFHDIKNLPFEVTEQSYSVMIGDFAEINYNGANGEYCCIRAGKDTEDISGDYNEYGTVKDKDIDGTTVTFKGNDKQYYLAVWIKDGHFYSVSLSEGTDEQKMTDLVRDVMG